MGLVDGHRDCLLLGRGMSSLFSADEVAYADRQVAQRIANLPLLNWMRAVTMQRMMLPVNRMIRTL